MPELKTKLTDENVSKFLNSVAEETKRKDSFSILDMMQQATGLPPKMWGTAIVGFGSYHYKYESGREGDSPLAGFASRANAIVLYLSLDPIKREEALQKLGKYKTGKGCIYIQKLSDVDTKVLGEMIKHSVINAQKKSS